MAATPVRVAVEKLLKVHRGAAMPRFSAMTFRSWARSHKSPPGTSRTVAYFHGCAAQEFEPEVGAAVVRVLERNGARVTFPKQGCCGLTLVSNGDFDAGRSYATRLVRNLRGAADDPGVIVASSTSCGMTLKAKYRELLGLDGRLRHLRVPGRAERRRPAQSRPRPHPGPGPVPPALPAHGPRRRHPR